MSFSTQPDSDVVDFLDTQLASLTKAVNLFRGPEVEARTAPLVIPVDAVFVAQTGGPAPMPYLGTGESENYPGLQIVIRNNGYLAGQAIANDVLETLSQSDVPGYINCATLESRANYVGRRDDNNHRWTVNAELIVEEPAA
jgi:hypothetical protein